ncbi:hypothetical protein MJ389_02410 [Escherichia coli]|nr:hypothetical protein MJ389_02410 [Escherichia coli]
MNLYPELLAAHGLGAGTEAEYSRQYSLLEFIVRYEMFKKLEATSSWNRPEHFARVHTVVY